MEHNAIGLLATQRYYVDHLASIWTSLTPSRRGPIFVAKRALKTAQNYGLTNLVLMPESENRNVLANFVKQRTKCPLLTASMGDWKIVAGAGVPAPTIPHGPGGSGHTPKTDELWKGFSSQVDMMLVPSQRAVYPFLHCEVIDGMPKLDRWYGFRPSNTKPVLAISFRWDKNSSAMSYYTPYLKEVKKKADKAGIKLLGHGHPLHWAKCKNLWDSLGIESSPEFEYVLSAADVYAADMSSTLFEFMALDRPVIFLWQPGFDKLHKGTRFSMQRAGIENRDPLKLVEDALRAYEDPYEIREARKEVVDLMFPGFEGKASVNAARQLELFYD